MPYQVGVANWSKVKPISNYAVIDHKAEAKRRAARNEEFTRQHPSHYKPYDALSEIPTFPLSPENILNYVELKKTAPKKLQHWANFLSTTLISAEVYDIIMQETGGADNVAFYKLIINNNGSESTHYLMTPLELLNSADYLKSGYTQQLNRDTGTYYWSSGAYVPNRIFHFDRSIVGSRKIWAEAHVIALFHVTDSLGEKLKPLLGPGFGLLRCEFT